MLRAFSGLHKPFLQSVLEYQEQKERAFEEAEETRRERHRLCERLYTAEVEIAEADFKVGMHGKILVNT